MACFHPLAAYRDGFGGVVVVGEGGEAWISRHGYELLVVPCGRCIGCRLVRARAWAIRSVHEAQMHKYNSFVTLTYDDAHYAPSLCYRDFQLFMYRLRKRLGATRFFMCGEYGEQTGRAHFHALLFGRTFFDGKECGDKLFRSATLESLWTNGFSTFGSVSYDSAAYCARYSCSKITGDAAKDYYRRVDLRTGEIVSVEPEFGHMSLRHGIGYSWFQKYWKEVFLARDGVVRPGGVVVPPPRYYHTLLQSIDGDLSDSVSFDRYVRSAKFAEDCTPARLLDRERCALAKQKFLKRATL